jgi:hypothetical protein
MRARRARAATSRTYIVGTPKKSVAFSAPEVEHAIGAERAIAMLAP